MNLTRVISAWQKAERELIRAHGHYVTIYYKPYTTGSSVNYDGFFGEAINSKTPDTVSGVTTTTGTPFVVSGIIYANPRGMSNEDSIMVMPIGQYEPDSVIFKCVLTEAYLAGVNKFDQSKYVVLSTDTTRRYQVLGTQRDGLGDAYVLYVHLGHSTVEGNV